VVVYVETTVDPGAVVVETIVIFCPALTEVVVYVIVDPGAVEVVVTVTVQTDGCWLLVLIPAALTPCETDVSERTLEVDAELALATRRAPHTPVTLLGAPTVLYKVHCPWGEPSAQDTSTQLEPLALALSQSWIQSSRLNVFVG
jgi:hypothetical protein